MKRICIALLIAAMALNLAACKKREKPIDPVSARIVDDAVRSALNMVEHIPPRHVDVITDEDRQGVEFLHLSSMDLTDLRPLLRLPNLERLALSACPNVTDLTPLAKLTQLETLDIIDCPGVSDLGPLLKLQNLKGFDIERCWKITDVPHELLDKMNNGVMTSYNSFYLPPPPFSTPAPTTEPPA